MIIHSEASVKVAIDVLAADDRNKKKWMYHSFYNLLWNNKTCVLTHCDKDGTNSFDILLKCPFLNCRIINHKSDIIEYLAEGYTLILPISTEKLGISGKDFFHNVYAKTATKEGTASIFDFWAPDFIWKEKLWDIQKLVDGTVINIDNHIYPVACKIRNVDNEYTLCFDINKMLDCYIGGYGGVGIDVYCGIIEWIANMESVYTLNHVVFITLEEHFKILENIFEDYLSNMSIFEDINKKVFAARNLSIKLWYSRKVSPYWKNDLIQRLKDIKKLENDLYVLFKQERDSLK